MGPSALYGKLCQELFHGALTMPCILCHAEKELTEEHVFPAFLGAELVVQDCSCRQCNVRCGKFEGLVADQTRTLRNLFDIANRYGEVPSAAVTVEAENFRIPARRDADGQVELYDVVTSMQTSDGGKEKRGFFVSEEAANRFLERARKRGEKVEELPPAKDFLMTPVSAQTLEFAFQPPIRQTAAKTALVALAYCQGLDFALQAQFDSLRESILNNPERVPVRIFANADFAHAHLRNPREHSVITYLSAGMHKGWSLVTFFGGLSYAVQLTCDFQERESRRYSLYYDAGKKAAFSPVVLYGEYDLIGRVLSPASKFESQEAVDEQWFPIVERDCRAKGVEVSRTKPD